MNDPLPVGFRVALDPATRVGSDGTLVWGGTPWRMLRLTAAGAELLSSLSEGAPVDDARGGVLARRLVDAGLAHPRPPAALSAVDVDVVVPARDRALSLDACLAALSGLAVTVVDDGSVDGFAVAAVASRHGARVIRRDRNGGPAAARNTGLAGTRRALVAFVDSDCVIDAAALLSVAGHLADPRVAAAAPRITEGVDESPLDLGPDASPVRPGARVPFVPTTALVVRRTAVEAVGWFDESMRYGEDVDLVWRLSEARWAVRYDPSIVAVHTAPTSRSGLLARKYHYGTSTGALARRHGQAMRGPALTGFLAPLRIRTLIATGLPKGEALRITSMASLRTGVALMKWTLPRTAADLAYHAGVARGCLSARTLGPMLPRLRAATQPPVAVPTK